MVLVAAALVSGGCGADLHATMRRAGARRRHLRRQLRHVRGGLGLRRRHRQPASVSALLNATGKTAAATPSTLTTGQIAQFDSTGAAWDGPGGAPDPFVCLTINGVRTCTSVKSDIFTPTWNESFPQATASALMTGVNIEIWDEDLTSNDVICPAGMLGVSQQSFVARTWGAMCTYGSFSATLVPK